MVVLKKLKEESPNLFLMYLLITFIIIHSSTLHIEILVTAWVLILLFVSLMGYCCYNKLKNQKDIIQFRSIKSIIDSKINLGFLLSLINVFLMLYDKLWISSIGFLIMLSFWIVLPESDLEPLNVS